MTYDKDITPELLKTINYYQDLFISEQINKQDGRIKLDKVKVVLIDSHNVNSYGFKINLEGLDLKRFKKNPVMLLQHDPDNLIGCWEDLAITDNNQS